MKGSAPFRNRVGRAAASGGHALLVLVLTGAITISLVRLAPGFGLDERLADPTLGAETRAQIAAQARSAAEAWRGPSTSYGIGAGEVIASRWTVTARTLAGGLLLAWGLALVAVLLPYLMAARTLAYFPAAVSVLLLATPAGLISLAAFIRNWPVSLVIAASVLPRIYFFLRGRFDAGTSATHVLAAESRGVSRPRLAWFHILRPELDEIAAVAAVSLKLALSAVIPAEVFGDVPGLGQAVWKAAQGRDLALIVPLTLLFAIILQAATFLAGLVPSPRMAARRTA
jgi:peptide/nickel transport system permease protein